jgi:hypothetical protein
MKSAANVGGNRLKTDWKRTCFSGFPPALAPELHSGAIMQGRIIASNACLSAPEEVVVRGLPLPVLLKATLLPFKDKIIYDGIIAPI